MKKVLSILNSILVFCLVIIILILSNIVQKPGQFYYPGFFLEKCDLYIKSLSPASFPG